MTEPDLSPDPDLLPELAPPEPPVLSTAHAVLFDLDGTLADTAPDLAAAVNRMRDVRGLPMVPLDKLRPVASRGARGLLHAAFGIGPDDAAFESMRKEFLDNYSADICVETTLFPGMPEILDDLDERRIRWGIVTNKIAALTEPLVALLGIDYRAGCIVSGDSTPFSKPHPAPLLQGARELAIDAARIVYVGDDIRDVQAGRAAGMITVAAGYGYCGDGVPAAGWGADHVVASTAELGALLRVIL
jgi:2-phosphoglycolate phosphatase